MKLSLRPDERPDASALGIGVAVLFLLLALFALPVLLTGCPGAKVSGGISVAVDPNACKENRSAVAPPTVNVGSGDAGTPTGTTPSASLVDLECAALNGTGTITVQFPREQWNAMRLRALKGDAGGDSLGK